MPGDVSKIQEAKANGPDIQHSVRNFIQPEASGSQDYSIASKSRIEINAMNTFIEKGAWRTKITSEYVDTLRTRIEKAEPSQYFGSSSDPQYHAYQHFHFHINELYLYSHEELHPPEKAIEAYESIELAYKDGTYHASIRQSCKSLGFPFAR